MTCRRPTMRAIGLCLLVAVTVALMAPAVRAADHECCATCIGKSSETPYNYDPLYFKQCGIEGLKRVCCFDCGAEQAASPEYLNAEFGTDGTTPIVKAGEWIQISWKDMVRVTYETYQKSQIKVTTVKNASAEAKYENDMFYICARTEGMVVFRGWGTDSCNSVTYEQTVNVTAGSTDGTCAEKTPSAPTSDSSSTQYSDPDVQNCNLQRASIIKVDGNDTCVCASEWTGAPECSGYPWWKVLVTVGGGVAAVLSIAVSIKAFMNSRKAKQAEAESSGKNDAILGEESITIAGGHNARGPPPPAAMPYGAQYSHEPQQAYGYHQGPATIKAQDNKEYSL